MEEYYFLLVKKGAQMAGMDKAQENEQEGLLAHKMVWRATPLHPSFAVGPAAAFG